VALLVGVTEGDKGDREEEGREKSQKHDIQVCRAPDDSEERNLDNLLDSLLKAKISLFSLSPSPLFWLLHQPFI